MASPAAAQAAQVVTVAAAAPLVSGVIGRVEARLQGRRGPRILQPYYDLVKLFGKESLAPDGASWVFLATPFIAFVSYLTVPFLIPVLTNYPLPLGYMGDILGRRPAGAVGTSSRGVIQRLLSPSVSRGLLQHQRRPVLVVPGD